MDNDVFPILQYWSPAKAYVVEQMIYFIAKD